MTGKVATSGRNVGDVCGTMLVAMLLVISTLLLVGPVASATYFAEDIGCSGYYSTIPGGINDQDQIAAWRIQTSSGSGQDAVIYDPGTGTWWVLPDYGTEPSLYSRAFDINDDGEVIGMCIQPTTYMPVGAYWPAAYTRLVPLEPLPGDPVSFAYAVNDLREAVGYSRSEVGPNTIVKWNLDHYATSIMPTELGVLYEMEMALPEDINNNHAIVGYAYNYSQGITSQGFYYPGSGENFQLLPHLSEVDAESSAEAISDSGLIVGWSRDDDGFTHAVVWPSPYDTVVDLGPVVGTIGYAFDISTDEKIVGISVSMDCGFVCDYTTGVCEYLPAPPGLSPCVATCINDNGHIAGIEADEYLGEEFHAVLWTPDTPPVAAFTATISGFDVTVDASSSYDAEGEIRDYRWDFGDGALGFEMIMTHTYTDVGPYTITLSVNDSVDQFDTLTLVVGFDKTPESEILELVVLIESTSFEQDIKDRLESKALKALDLIEIRKKGGDDGPANILLSLDNLVSNYVLAGEIADTYEAWDVVAQTNFVISLLAENRMVAGVPVYTWYHGCGPTAAGMLLGYWDSTGFGNLVSGMQGNEMFQSDDVNAMIASQGHIDDYVYPLDGWVDGVWVDIQADNSTYGGAHSDNCVADFMHTSRSSDGLVWGQSYANMVDDALVEYTAWVSGGDYVADAETLEMGSLTWEFLQSEVDGTRPMVFVIDWDGNGETDHLVTVLGYCEVGNAQLYAFHSTWDNYVWWALFEPMHEGNFYGVSSGVSLSVSMAP